VGDDEIRRRIMDTDVKVLAEIAKDKEVVGWLEEAVENGTLLDKCPTPFGACGVLICSRLCHKIWLDLMKKAECPCNKPRRIEIAHVIIALSKLVEEPRTYRVGDVFGYAKNDLLYIISLIGSTKFSLIGLGSISSPNSGSRFVTRSQCISLGELTGLPSEYQHLGHFTELSFKNGKVVPS
jgi:hypothetical protein